MDGAGGLSPLATNYLITPAECCRTFTAPLLAPQTLLAWAWMYYVSISGVHAAWRDVETFVTFNGVPQMVRGAGAAGDDNAAVVASSRL